ncbi:MAG: hypothetical protein U5K84_03765 [Alkalibacterium sp.]|nr:hypothetical protein [Alkalibacterium sp.]
MGFSTVHPESMTTLEDALGQPFTVDNVKSRIRSVFADADVTLKEGPLTSSIHASYQEGLDKMIKRNEKMLPRSTFSPEG